MRLPQVKKYFANVFRSSYGFVPLLPIFILGFLALTLLLVVGNVDEEQDLEGQAQTPPVTLFLQPSSGNLSLDSDVSVQVRISTSEQVNAVQANVSFPTDRFQFVSIDPAGSAFGIEAQAQESNGTVFIARGSITPVTGEQLIATIKLRTKAVSGSATVNFAAGSEVVSSVTNQSLPTTLTGGTYTIGQVTANGSISLLPATGSFAQNTEVRVAVRENSGTTPVNAVQANVSFPTDKLDFVAIDTTGSDFPIAAQGTNNNGTVMIARGATTPVSGDKLVATIVLRTKTTAGQAVLNFANGTEVISSQTNTPLTLTQNGATYTVSGASPSVPPGTSTPAPTPTPTPTPTVLPTVPPTVPPTVRPTTPPTNPPSNNNGGNRGGGSSSGPSAPSCNDSPPTSAPDLFQIDTTHNTANLHFAPAARPITYYYLAFGYTEGDERFGATWQQGYSPGALQFKVNFLSPNSTYWFRIRGGNGCTPGAWSKWVKVQTKPVPAPAKKPNVIRRVARKITRPVRRIVRKIIPRKVIPKRKATVQPKASVRPTVTPRR